MKLNKFLERFIQACLFIVPVFLLVFFQQTLYPFITFKTYGFQVVIELLVISWVILAYRAPVFRPKVTKIVKAVFLFLVIATVSGLLSADPVRSLWSTPERLMGVIALWHFFAYFLALTVFLRAGLLKKYVQYLFWVSVVVALFAILQSIAPSIFYVKIGTRPGGTLGNPAYLAGFLLSYLFLGYYLIRNSIGWKRIAYAAGTLVVAYSFLMANTRGAMLGLMAAIAFALGFTLYHRYRSGKDLKWIVGSLVACVILFVGVIYATHDAPIWKKIPGIDRLANFSIDDGSIASRLISWKVAVKGFAQAPVLGVGPENFRIVSDTNYDPRLYRGGFSETYFDKPHNVLLEMLSTTGIIGFAAYIWILYLLWREIGRLPGDSRYKILARATLLGYIVQNLFLFDTFGSYLTFFAAMALLSMHEPEAQSPVVNQVPARAKSLIALALGVPVSLALLTANASTVYANLENYKVINLFTQNLPEQAMVAYKNAAKAYYPFKSVLAQSAMGALVTVVRGSTLSNPELYIDPVLHDAETAAQQRPLDYMLRIALADSKVIFSLLNGKYLTGVDKDLAEAEKISPNRQQTLFVRSNVNVVRRNKDGALADMRAAVALDPLAANSHYNYAMALMRFNTSSQEITDELLKAFELGKKVQTATENALLAGYFDKPGYYDKAYDFMKAAYELEPSNKEYLLKYGIVSFNSGKNDQARSIFTQVLAKYPEIRQSPSWPQIKELFEAAGTPGV